METFNTKYGNVTLYKNEIYIGHDFRCGKYWDEDTLLKLKPYIKPNKNILEIGAHCGTSSLIYASFLNPGAKLFAYEPQYNMYQLLVKNIIDNRLPHVIIPVNKGVFCYEGNGVMNSIDLDGGGGNVEKRYNEENYLGCNFGGVGLGEDGEVIELTTIDAMNIPNLGFIHCDAQGAENFIFAKGIETITKYRPVILYENPELGGEYLYYTVCKSYPKYQQYSRFNVKKFCLETLHYSNYIDRFNGSNDTLLIP
jgi:FkbM family methyltransferase